MNVLGEQINTSPRGLVPEQQKYKDTCRCVALRALVPRHSGEQLTQTLIVRMWKKDLFSLTQNIKSTIVPHLYGNSVPDVRHDVVVIVPTARAVCVLVTWKLLVALNRQWMICLIHSRTRYLV